VKLADDLAILNQHGTLKVIEEDVVAEDVADFHGLEEQSLLNVLVFLQRAAPGLADTGDRDHVSEREARDNIVKQLFGG
jgi:hypothetical protein